MVLLKFQQVFAQDEDTDNVEELFDNRMKEAGWNFGMGICNAYLGTDLRANSFNGPCKVGALPVGIAVEQSCHYFQIICQT